MTLTWPSWRLTFTHIISISTVLMYRTYFALNNRPGVCLQTFAQYLTKTDLICWEPAAKLPQLTATCNVPPCDAVSTSQTQELALGACSLHHIHACLKTTLKQCFNWLRGVQFSKYDFRFGFEKSAVFGSVAAHFHKNRSFQFDFFDWKV